jgi:flagellar basal-body rod modification protein FlgD
MPVDMDIVNAALVRQRTPEEAANARAANQAKKTQLDQNDFLKLMITQLQNQDPFKPLDPAEHVGQLAQFSSVSGLQSINQSIAGLTASMRGNAVLDGAALIGRTIVAPGDKVYVSAANGAEGSGAQGIVDVPKGTSALQLVVHDASGVLVKSEALNNDSGMHSFRWDGSTNAGTAAAAGQYKVEIIASVGGKNVSLPTSFAAHVASVSIDSTTGGLTLDTDVLGDVSMSDVERVL